MTRKTQLKRDALLSKLLKLAVDPDRQRVKSKIIDLFLDHLDDNLLRRAALRLLVTDAKQRLDLREPMNLETTHG